MRVRLLADDTELFVLGLPATMAAARELKVALPTETGRLDAPESTMGLRREADVRGFTTRGLGLRLIIGAGEITVAQDYYPIRRGP